MDFFKERKNDLAKIKQEVENIIAIRQSKLSLLEKELKDLLLDKAKIEGRIEEVILLDKSFSESPDKKKPKISSGIIDGEMSVEQLIKAKQKTKKKEAK